MLQLKQQFAKFTKNLAVFAGFSYFYAESRLNQTENVWTVIAENFIILFARLPKKNFNKRVADAVKLSFSVFQSVGDDVIKQEIASAAAQVNWKRQRRRLLIYFMIYKLSTA